MQFYTCIVINSISEINVGVLYIGNFGGNNAKGKITKCSVE